MMPGPWFMLSMYMLGVTPAPSQEAVPTGRPPAWPEQGCIGQAKDLGLADGARFSPDGASLVAARTAGKGHDIVVLNLATGAATPLVTDGSDDVDPVWLPDGKGVVFASNRGGDYDLYSIGVAPGSKAVRLTSHKGDERAPSVSPIPFVLNGLVLEGCGGPAQMEVGRYHKIAYEASAGGKIAVRFVSSDGKHDDVIAAECRAPEYASDGLSLAMLCGDQVKVVSGEILSADRAADIYYEGEKAGKYPTLDALRAEKEKWEREAPGERPGPDQRISAKVPKRFLQYDLKQMEAPAGKAQRVALSHNQLLLFLAAQQAETMQIVDRTSAQPGKAAPAGVEASFSKKGDQVLWIAPGEGGNHLFVAGTSCPLQSVGDLIHYPELWKGGLPASLISNQFVALPSQEKEFFHLYEKARYKYRGILVTPDALLQAFSDVFSRMLQARERTLAVDVLEYCTLGLDAVKGLKGPTAQYVQVLFAVPKVILEAGLPDFAANDLVPPWEQGGVEEESGANAPKPAETREQRLNKAIEALPAAIRPGVRQGLAQLGQQKVEAVEAGGMKYVVDFTLAKPRGHYDAPGYRDYFLAVQWLSQMPFPLDDVGVQAAAAVEKNQEAVDAKRVIEGVTGALAGLPAVPTLSDVMAVYPGGKVGKGHTGKLGEEALTKHFGPLKVRTPTLAQERGDAMEVRILPPRLVMDTEVFRHLTHPDVQLRGMPTALDLFAALETPGVVDLITAPDGESWTPKDYAAGLVKAKASAASGLQADTLYVRWIKLVKNLAAARPDGAATLPGFVKSDAYRFRLLQTALAGFTQVKHHLVLYSAQDMAVECDGDTLVALLFEVPLRPEPPAWVEPLPEFYRELAELARQTYRFLGVDAGEPDSYDEGVVAGSLEWYFPDVYGGPVSIERLARAADFFEKMARKHLAGQPLLPEEEERIRVFGGHLEGYMTGLHSHFSGYTTGGDQGRNERGVTLVVDLLFNPQRNLVLHDAVGLPYEMYALVPRGDSQGVVLGGLLSWFEFTAPERLTDEQWWNRVKANDLPAVAPWACSFVECPATAP